jgi:probable HAF family extracellular repeat protein
MKTILTYIILAVACHSLANAQTKYTITPIAQGVGNGINNEGDVVGTLNGVFQPYITEHAFLYKGGKLTDLGAPTASVDSSAVAVNDFDEVAGSIFLISSGFTIGADAFFYKNGQWVVFATGVPEGVYAQVNAINNQGEIVGSYPAPNLPPYSFATHGFVYRNGILVDLGTLGGIDSYASAINSAGQIVGIADNTAGEGEAFIYSNGRMQSVGGPLTSSVVSYRIKATTTKTTTTTFDPFAINDHGWIGVDFSTSTITTTTTSTETTTTGNDSTYAALYINGKLYNLGTLAGFTGSRGASINNSGTVVGNLLGNITTPNDVYVGVTGGFVYSNGRMYDLNTLLETVGWKITGVGQINEAGQIAATGTYGGQTVTYALLLTPVPVRGQILP